MGPAEAEAGAWPSGTRPWQPAAPPGFRGIVPVLAAAIGVATLVVVPRSELRFTTYAGVSASAGIADAAAGIGLVVAGLLVWALRPDHVAGFLVSSAGVSWFAPDWIGWESGAPLARGVAGLVEPFFLPLIVHLVLAGSGGRLRSDLARIAVGAFYATAAVVAVGLALLRDPFYDPRCWNDCTLDVFLVSNRPAIARSLEEVASVSSVVAGFLLVVVAIHLLSAAPRPARRLSWPVLLPASLVGAGSAGQVFVLAGRPFEDPREPLLTGLFLGRAWAAAALAVGVTVVVVRAWRTRRALGRIASEIDAAPTPGTFAQALARATHDASLEVWYPRAGAGGYVDPAGRLVALPGAGDPRTLTPIVRGDDELALVVHDAGTVDVDQLRRELGPAGRLAIDNERLHAQLLAELEALRGSRTRVVAAGDAERRKLERNLHDGAQQQLLALVFDLRRGRSREEAADGDGELATLLAGAQDDALQAVDDLRELAHGIYPAVLTEAGLGPAVTSLADRSPVPVEVEMETTERYSELVERTAYLAVADAIEAASASRTSLTILVRRDGDRLVVAAEGVGPGPFVDVEDRVGALGGSVTVDGRSLRVELPCA